MAANKPEFVIFLFFFLEADDKSSTPPHLKKNNRGHVACCHKFQPPHVAEKLGSRSLRIKTHFDPFF